jgi:hypothetical protein
LRYDIRPAATCCCMADILLGTPDPCRESEMLNREGLDIMPLEINW